MSLRIGHMPNHGPSVNERLVDKIVGQIDGRLLNSASLSEGYRAVPMLRRRTKDVRVFTGSGGNKKDRYNRVPSFDNPIVIPRDMEGTFIGSGSERVSKAFWPNLKWNPERWMVWVIYRHPIADASICHITVHPTVRKGRQRQALRKLKQRIAWAQNLGMLVIVTGDLQTRDDRVQKDSTHSLRPADIFDNAKMDFRVQHLDWIAWDSRLALKNFESIPPNKIAEGQDHWWLFVTLIRRTAR